MKKIILFITIAIITTSMSSAEAMWCANIVRGGYIYFNHRAGYAYGSNFYVRLSCSRNAPKVLIWNGGYMCTGRTYYGRNNGRTFSCKPTQLGYR